MKIQHLQGLFSAPFSPLNAQGELDLGLIPAYYAFLRHNGIAGVFINGSTGEGASLTLSEKKLVAEAWAKASNHDPDFRVMVLLGGTCLVDCADLARHAEKAGLYAVSLTSPFYFKPANINMLAKSCIAVASAVPTMPFYYYHIPILTGGNFSMLELLKALDGKMDNLAGVKYTHEDFMDFQSCLGFQNGKYNMLWGRDENMLSALAAGSKGAVGSTFNYAAPLYHELINAFNRNDLSRAQHLQQKSIDMIRLLDKYGGIAAGKAYMKLAGVDCGEFRLPVSNMTAEQFESFKLDVYELGFSDFKSMAPPRQTFK
ncbi:MAG: dihydrodipicolinate synthetase [Candidatus Nephrothrix sp. EaCA]|nr:MAG: dihydrodipicolinate synthetase [Candidatus Nephrothrix sp. EaCA]